MCVYGYLFVYLSCAGGVCGCVCVCGGGGGGQQPG